MGGRERIRRSARARGRQAAPLRWPAAAGGEGRWRGGDGDGKRGGWEERDEREREREEEPVCFVRCICRYFFLVS